MKPAAETGTHNLPRFALSIKGRVQFKPLELFPLSRSELPGFVTAPPEPRGGFGSAAGFPPLLAAAVGL